VIQFREQFVGVNACSIHYQEIMGVANDQQSSQNRWFTSQL